VPGTDRVSTQGRRIGVGGTAAEGRLPPMSKIVKGDALRHRLWLGL